MCLSTTCRRRTVPKEVVSLARHTKSIANQLDKCLVASKKKEQLFHTVAYPK